MGKNLIQKWLVKLRRGFFLGSSREWEWELELELELELEWEWKIRIRI